MTALEISQKWSAGRIEALKNNYLKMGLQASGNWPKQLKDEVTQKGSNINISIYGEQYTGALINGRSRNKNNDKESLRKFAGWAGSTFIAKWVKDKGLNLNPYAVAYSIGEKGINVPNKYNTGKLISDVINEKSINDLVNEIGSSILVKFEINDFK